MQEARLYLIFEFLSMDLKKYLDSIPSGQYMDPMLVKVTALWHSMALQSNCAKPFIFFHPSLQWIRILPLMNWQKKNTWSPGSGMFSFLFTASSKLYIKRKEKQPERFKINSKLKSGHKNGMAGSDLFVSHWQRSRRKKMATCIPPSDFEPQQWISFLPFSFLWLSHDANDPFSFSRYHIYHTVSVCLSHIFIIFSPI